VLLAKGATLTQGSIRALRRRGFRAVYVRDGLADDIEPMDVVSEQVQATVVRRMHDLFAMVQHAARASAEKGKADLLLAKWQKLWERLSQGFAFAPESLDTVLRIPYSAPGV